MNGWKFNYEGKEYEVCYNIYHLTDGETEYAIHELQYKKKIFREDSLEKVVGKLVKSLRRDIRDTFDKEEMER